ncbi:MAG: hypothetical protein SGARI_005060 [Bacillariaceae sp.]
MSSSAKNTKVAAQIAVDYAKHLTAAAKGGSLDAFKSLFADSCFVVLQDGEGQEVEFTLGEGDDCNMTWDQFTEAAFKDLEAQKYDYTTSNCLGVLGQRMILETGRMNTDAELYMMASMLVEFREDGKIVGIESFNSVDIDTALDAVAKTNVVMDDL